VLAPFEPQLAKARGIEDAAKRKAAIADVESQVVAQQENAALVAELKKAHPSKDNLEIADLAAPRIRVPKVPLGMDADEFDRVQALIRKYLKDKGFHDAEGFATGSRVTGVTFNPTKGPERPTPFGHATTDFAKRDFDITIITSTPLKPAQQKELKQLYLREFKHPLGIRPIHDRRMLAHIRVYGKIDLTLK